MIHETSIAQHVTNPLIIRWWPVVAVDSLRGWYIFRFAVNDFLSCKVKTANHGLPLNVAYLHLFFVIVKHLAANSSPASSSFLIHTNESMIGRTALINGMSDVVRIELVRYASLSLKYKCKRNMWPYTNYRTWNTKDAAYLFTNLQFHYHREILLYMACKNEIIKHRHYITIIILPFELIIKYHTPYHSWKRPSAVTLFKMSNFSYAKFDV